MKILKVIAGVVLALFIIGSCGGNDTVAEKTPEPAASDTYADTTDSASNYFNNDEESFLVVAHAKDNPIIEANTDAQIVDTAHTVCNALDTGSTVSDLSNELIATGDYKSHNAIEFAAIMLAGAVTYLCPEYSSQVPQ